MAINTAFLDELEGKAVSASQDYLFPQPVAQKRSGSINLAFVDSLEAGEAPEVQENKAKAVLPSAIRDPIAMAQGMGDLSWSAEGPGPQSINVGPRTESMQPDNVRAAEAPDKRIGLVEDIKRADIIDVMAKAPFSPYRGAKEAGYVEAKKRLAKNNYEKYKNQRYEMTPMGGYTMVEPKRTKAADQAYVADFDRTKKEEAERGFTIPAKIGKGVAELVPWAAEIYATGGGSAGSRTWMQILKQAGKTTLLQPHRFNEEMANIKIEDPEAQDPMSFAKAYGRVYIENFSELTGGKLVAGGGKLIKKLPFGKLFLTKLDNVAQKLKLVKSTKDFLNRISTRAGYDGLLGEMGEERVATILHGIANTHDFGAGKDAPWYRRVIAGMSQDMQPENLLVETAVLSLPGAAKYGIGKVIDKTAKPVTPPPGFEVEKAKVLKGDLEKPKTPIEKAMVQQMDEMAQPPAAKPKQAKDAIAKLEPSKEAPKGKEAQVEKKVYYTSVPDEWHSETDLYDWGKKGLRSSGNRKIGKRKTFIWTEDLEQIPVRLPKATMDAFKEKTGGREMWKVHVRKGDDYYLVPKRLAEELRETLGKDAFRQRPAPERSPLQKVNDTINSASRRGLTDAEIGGAIEGYAETLGLTEKDLSVNQKKYIEVLNNDPEAQTIRQSFREGVEQEVPTTYEEIDERTAIQEEHLAKEVGDFLDGLEETAEKPRQKDLIGRPVLKGGATGKQTEIFGKEEFKKPATDIEGQGKLFAKPKGGSEPTIEVPSQQGGFAGGRPGKATTKVSAIVKEDMKTGSKQADAFLERTKGFTSSGQPGILRKVARSIGGVFKEFHYLVDLPKQAEYADVREAFRHTEEIKRLAYDTAVEKMRWALKPIEGVKWETRARMKALEMKIIADDLAEDVEKGVDLPSGLTKTDVKTTKARADELYEKYPSIRDSYDRIRQRTQEIGDLLVSEGMLDASRAKEFYFPHKVIKYLRENDSFFGIPTKKPADYKKGYLKQRKGGVDYSTDIMERLVEHWAQVQRDVDYSRFLAKTLKQEQANYFKKEHPDWQEFTKAEDGTRVRNLVPGGYKEVTVLPGRFYYSTHGVTEDMAKAIIAQNLDSIEEMLEEDAAKQVRKVLAVGKKKSFIVREPIAKQIHDMPTMPISTASAYLAVKGFNTFVKGQILFNPLYALPFHVTNFTGDAHKVLVAAPGALQSKYLANYWKEIVAAHKGEKSERFEMAQKTGVIGSGWIGTDLPELKAIIPEIERAEVSGAGKHLANKAKRLWNISKKVGAGREDWLRYALFDYLSDQQEAGVDIIKYAIKDSKTLTGITDKGTLAAKIARDIAGDYAAIGKTGKMLSDLAIPFYRWMHLNLPWWPRMMKEYAKKGQAGRLAYALMAAAAPYILSTLWNYSDEERRKFEKSLPYWKRWNFHIVSLHGKKMYYIPLPLDDVANFIGVPEDILDYQRYQRGMITGSELAKRIAWNSLYEPGMSIVNAVGGLAGVVRDTVGVTTYPDIKPWLEKRWSRKSLNIAGDIFGAPAQLGKAIQREGIQFDDLTGEVILGTKTKDTLNRAWMGIRPYSVDLERTEEMKRKSVYKQTKRFRDKKTGKKVVQKKGEAHKGKQRLVDSLTIQLEGQRTRKRRR